tara:strand:- start:121 stop:378 length:258 start_codon:yes stop_codon:yes gene_type:complete
MKNNSLGKTWAKKLSGLVRKLDRAYRSGNAQVSDRQFDQLKNRLREIDPQSSYFQQKMKLLLYQQMNQPHSVENEIKSIPEESFK